MYNFQKIYIFFLKIKTLNPEIKAIKTLSFFKKLCYNSSWRWVNYIKRRVYKYF